MHKSNTKFPFKTVYCLGVRGLTTSSSVDCDYTISGHMDLGRVYICIAFTVYIHCYRVYILFYSKYLCSNAVKMFQDPHPQFFGTVHSDRSMEVSGSNTVAYVNNLFDLLRLFSPHYDFCQFFNWIALGDVDLCFSPMFVRKASATEEQTRWTMWLYITNVIHPYTWLIAWKWHHFLLASNRRQVCPWIVYAKLR